MGQLAEANNVVITNTYDAMNRPLTRSYSDSTPTVTYTYDDTQVPYSKGRLTKIASTVSETRYTEYDEMGRLEKSEQRTDGEVYPSEYKYNLAGMLVEQTYPSGRVVKHVLDANGDISMIQSKKNANAGYWNYASHFSYNAAGAVTSMQLGNGLWETAQFNSRLQSTQLGLGALPTGANLWKVDYEFGELQTNGTVDAVKNSGNIARQTLTVPGTSFVQSYTYDSLYRLTEAVEKTGTTTNWFQQFGYDRYGNRTSFGQDIGGIAKNTTPAIDANTNRFTSTDFGYDANGNIVEDVDEVSLLPREFIFNGDNKQTEVKRDGVTIGLYYYDGEGRRVKKVTDTETTVFVYSGGQLIAEYSTNVAPTEEAKVSYTTADHLGSPRVLTDKNAQVSSRRDFMPFGEELYAGVGPRTGDTGLKYSSSDDDIRQKFTGYERDNESELDFAEARYYNPMHGRFTSVDPEGAGAFAENPQTWNAYAYVGNNPVNITDPDGLSWYFNSSIGEAGHYKWYEDNETPAEGYRLVNGVANHVYYAGEDVGYVALNPLANKFQIFDTREAALNRVDDIYSCPSCQTLVDSVAEQADTKSRVVISAAAAGGAVGVCIGTAGAGCVIAKEGAEAIIELQLGTSIDLGTMRNRSTKVRTTKGNTTIYDRRGGASQANTDFNNMNPTQVKDIQTPYGPGRTGKLPSGETVTVRPGSSGQNGAPTIEIRRNNRKTDEFRYR